MGISQVDLTKAISALRVPTLILSGDDDVIISPRKSVVLHQQIAGSRLVNVLAGGHYLHVEQPEVAAAEIRDFLVRSPLVSR
jgi:pimeloyl-ACP methyl ester carboxylesterase